MFYKNLLAIFSTQFMFWPLRICNRKSSNNLFCLVLVRKAEECDFFIPNFFQVIFMYKDRKKSHRSTDFSLFRFGPRPKQQCPNSELLCNTLSFREEGEEVEEEGLRWKIMDFWLQPFHCPSANPLDVKL